MQEGNCDRGLPLSLTPTGGFFAVFPFVAQFTLEDIPEPVGRTLCCLHQFSGNETSNEAVASSVFGIVIDEKIVRVFASFR